jgi:hypothetical protein
VRRASLPKANRWELSAVVSLEDEEGWRSFQSIDGIADTIGGPVAAKSAEASSPGRGFATVVGPKEAKNYDMHFEQDGAGEAGRKATWRSWQRPSRKGRFKIPIAK